MPEALQVRLKVWVYSTLLLPLILTEEGGARGAICIIVNISIVPITNIGINIICILGAVLLQ